MYHFTKDNVEEFRSLNSDDILKTFKHAGFDINDSDVDIFIAFILVL